MKPRRDLRWTLFSSLALPGGVLLLFLASTITFGLLYAFTGESVYQNLLLLVGLGLLFAFIGVTTFVYRRLYSIFHAGLYEVSIHNMNALSRGDAHFKYYPMEYPIEEFKELNQGIKEVENRYSVSVLYSLDLDYSKLDIPWTDEEHHLVEEAYLMENLANFISMSKAFSVGLLNLHYELRMNPLTKEEGSRLLTLADQAFAFLPGRLFAFTEDGKGLLCLLPNLDSLRIVRDLIAQMREDCSIARREAGGTTVLPLQAAMACYPYSSIEDIVSDLRYAKRQRDPINIFLPDRKKVFKDGGDLFKNADTVAFFNKVLLPIRHLTPLEDEKNKEVLQTVFANVCSYVGSDFHDVVLYEPNSRTFHSYFHDHLVDPQLIEAMMSIVDEDNSFYFSSRLSCSHVISRFVDEYGVSSGFIYAMADGKDILGAVYLGRKSGTMLLDSYMKEALIRMGEAFTDHFFLREKELRAQTFQRDTEHILGLSDYMLYRIDDETMKLTYLSPNLKKIFPHAELGEPCHKALYGYEKMCPLCPLNQNRKKVETIAGAKGKNGQTFITSLTLNSSLSHDKSMLVERQDKKENPNPYDADWLVYTFRFLVDSLRNAYLINSRGYLLLLKIDNLSDLLGVRGSEGLTFLIRAFIAEIKRAIHSDDVYIFDPACIAILLPRYGHVEVLDECERIYEISKRNIFDGTTDKGNFQLTYLPMGYPHGHASADDFLARVEDFYHYGNHPSGKDFIYFQDHSISRSASKKMHMLSVIDEVFGSKAASCMYLQPMLLAADKRMVGAEILLRVEDTMRRNFFRADEISRLALENERISLITESILNFVGALYKEHGSSIFQTNNFRRISINVDNTFLQDANLSAKVKNLYAEHHMEKDFLAFEVPEDLVSAAMEGNETFSLGAGTWLTCDHYTGKHVGMEKLKKYGFQEVKLPRDMINGIEVDAKKRAALEAVVRQAKELGLKVSVVGVENEGQYLVLKELDGSILIQGYYFYKPLSRSELITAIISHGK